jgi:hypothetical protein
MAASPVGTVADQPERPFAADGDHSPECETYDEPDRDSPRMTTPLMSTIGRGSMLGSYD